MVVSRHSQLPTIALSGSPPAQPTASAKHTTTSTTLKTLFFITNPPLLVFKLYNLTSFNYDFIMILSHIICIPHGPFIHSGANHAWAAYFFIINLISGRKAPPFDKL